jgi:hypothetical protein
MTNLQAMVLVVVLVFCGLVDFISFLLAKPERRDR